MTDMCANPGCPNPVGDRRADALYCGDACKTAVCRERKAAASLAALVTSGLRPNALRPAAHRVLRALIAAGDEGATTRTLCQPQVGGCRFGARVAEIRAAGLTIVQHRERNGSHRYWLVSEQQERAA